MICKVKMDNFLCTSRADCPTVGCDRRMSAHLGDDDYSAWYCQGCNLFVIIDYHTRGRASPILHMVGKVVACPSDPA